MTAVWTQVQGRLADGLPMRLFLAENHSQIWLSCTHDDEHPRTEDEFVWHLRQQASYVPRAKAVGVLGVAAWQAEEYFRGSRQTFDFPLSLRGTEFQKQVWTALTAIPFGHVESYAAIADAVGKPAACRAVGNANGRNRIGLFVPCHRVIASGGKLGGYTGGLGLKRRLLAHEAAVLGKR